MLTGVPLSLNAHLTGRSDAKAPASGEDGAGMHLSLERGQRIIMGRKQAKHSVVCVEVCRNQHAARRPPT